ncbi:DUF1360 domain-containing protein [Alteribacter natronophilus]|uniref:DUF1360 domain-containing protein n=1 Tax=Alteribacter natronophilus TaxID=2583810 RepID=UPI00110E357E|nr:DUF1360 domain-containing protein [Alteribacter natronophilus]TMW72953.1 DUF1360 domain-containing protein [Alteribacter natronophilus]
MALSWLMMVLLVLAVFRVTHLIVYDTITERFRNFFLKEVEEEGEVFYEPREGPIIRHVGSLLSCHWCTGMWVSVFFTAGYFLFPAWFNAVIVIFAVAGAAAVLHSVVVRYLF